MAKRVFLSFVEEDLDLVRPFRAQAHNENLDLEFDDYSVKVPYDSNDAGYIKSKIREKIGLASVTICLIGRTTYTSKWVEWEIIASADAANRLIGVRLHSNAVTDLAPAALVARRAPVVNWEINQIARLIG